MFSRLLGYYVFIYIFSYVMMYIIPWVKNNIINPCPRIDHPARRLLRRAHQRMQNANRDLKSVNSAGHHPQTTLFTQPLITTHTSLHTNPTLQTPLHIPPPPFAYLSTHPPLTTRADDLSDVHINECRVMRDFTICQFWWSPSPKPIHLQTPHYFTHNSKPSSA